MPNDPDASPDIPRRRWPLRYVLLFVAGWVAFPVIVWLVWGWIESTRLDRALDALEARQEPLDVAEFNARPTTPAQTEASHLYAEAARLVGGHGIPTQESTRVSQLIQELCATPPGTTANTNISRELQAFEEPFAKAFELIDRASPLRGVGWAESDRSQRQPVFELWPITLTRANVARIARRACTGDTDGTAPALLAGLRLQRFVNVKVVTTQTAHSLQLVLSGGASSPEMLQQIQDEYASASSDRTFEHLMLRERAFWLFLILPGVFSEPPAGSRTQRITPLEAVATRLARPLRDHRLVADLNEFDAALEVAKQPWPKLFDAVNAFAKAHQRISSQSMPPGLLERLTRPWGSHFPANVMTSYVNGIAETLARARASVGAVAVARYQRDHAGAMPATLQQLTPAYLTAPLIDPYSGAELKFHRNATGYKIYSVGANGKDDGGEWEQQPDLLLSRRGNPPDIGIAVDSGPSAKRGPRDARPD